MLQFDEETKLKAPLLFAFAINEKKKMKQNKLQI